MILAAVLSGFVAAGLAPWLHRTTRDATGWLLALLPLAIFLYLLSILPAAARGEALLVSYPWVPSLGITLSFHADGLGLLMALLISGIGALITLYSGGYLHGHDQLGRWYAFLLMFMASMLGVVLADNTLTLFVFWELTSVSSYLLIGFNHKEEASRSAALQALLVTGAGGLAMLAGLVLLGSAGGSYTFSDLVLQGDAVQESPYFGAILALILAGCFTKSAQFPFHFWLPSAMAAPTPASAYLHSSTMVKAGVYLLARLSPVFSGSDAWFWTVTSVGAVTMTLGAVMAYRQTIMKRLLAYSTVSALGTITMLLGLGTPGAAQAAVAFLFAHALYKAALFLVAGAVDHGTGERDVRRLGGLAGAMPRTLAGAVVAGLSMAGIPLLFGFVAKEMLYETTLHAPAGGTVILTALTVAASAVFFVVALSVVGRPFFGARTDTSRHPHEAPLSMWLGPAILGTGSLLFGLWPDLLGPHLLGPAAAAAAPGSPTLHLALWHGLNPALGLSALTVLLGIVLYLSRERLLHVFQPLAPLAAWGPERWYEELLHGMTACATWQTRILQSGYLRVYLRTIVLVILGLTGLALFEHSRAVMALILRHLTRSMETVTFYELGLAAVITMAIGAAVHSRTRLAAVAALGVVGYGVALIFVFYGAPDLAMTQFVIETLTVILFVLVFYHLPPFAIYASRASRARDLVISIAMGVMMAVLVLVAVDEQAYPSISEFFAQQSYTAAHGRNVVNVILVDFRGIDTMGEITVLAVAGIGAYALIRLRSSKRDSR